MGIKLIILVLLLVLPLAGQIPGHIKGIMGFGGGIMLGDITPPTAPAVTLVRSDATTLDMTTIFHGGFVASEGDSIFVRKKNGSYPSSKTDGDSIYTGTDTLQVNSKNFAHGLSSANTVYLRVFVQDSIPNITHGQDYLFVNEGWITIARFDSTTFNGSTFQ